MIDFILSEAFRFGVYAVVVTGAMFGGYMIGRLSRQQQQYSRGFTDGLRVANRMLDGLVAHVRNEEVLAEVSENYNGGDAA